MLKTLKSISLYSILAIFSLITVYPLIWIVFGSLKTNTQFYNNTWGLPSEFNIHNYIEAWYVAELGARIGNSIFVTTISLALLLLISIIAAYALARIPFPGNKIINIFIIASMMVPLQAIIVPLFIVIRDMGLLNTRLSLILVYVARGIAFSVIILYGFFKTIPDEMEDAAAMDGANRWQILLKVMLPLARPGILTVAIFQGMEIWNEYFLALNLINDPGKQTIPLGLAHFFSKHETEWSLYFSALTTTIIPIVIVFIIFQKKFTEGLTGGAVKG